MPKEMTAFYRFACLIILFRRCLTEILHEEREVQLTSLNGTITSPSSTPKQTDSPSKFSYKWNIQLKNATKHRHVELQFTAFVLSATLPQCSDGDFVELFIGCENSTSIGKFCGRTSLPIIYSFDHCLQVVLHMHYVAGARARSEFMAFYNQRLLSKAVSREYYGCGKDLHSNARHGNVFSPHWPLPYPHYVDCVWHMITGPGLHVKLIFYDFDVRLTHLCEVDFVKVNTGAEFDRRGYTSDNRDCGRRRPFALTLIEDSIFIHFKSGLASGNRGFMAGFLAYEIDDQENNSQVVIVLGVIFSILFALAGKTLLVKILQRNKLDKNSSFRRLRKSIKSVGALWRGIHELERRESVAARWKTSISDPETEEERSPRTTPRKSVTFKTVTPGRMNESPKNYIVSQNEPKIP